MVERDDVLAPGFNRAYGGELNPTVLTGLDGEPGDK